MPRLTVHLEPVYANPSNYPADRLKKLFNKLENYMKNDLGRTLQKDMEATVENWKGKPDMVKTVSTPYNTRIQLTIEPKGRGATNWRRISEGTKLRTIRAKTPRGMSFQKGYTPKTTPGGRYGGSGARYGKWYRNVSQVKHKIEARKFAPRIMKKRERQIHMDVTNIVHRVAKKGFF